MTWGNPPPLLTKMTPKDSKEKKSQGVIKENQPPLKPIIIKFSPNPNRQAPFATIPQLLKLHGAFSKIRNTIDNVQIYKNGLVVCILSWCGKSITSTNQSIQESPSNVLNALTPSPSNFPTNLSQSLRNFSSAFLAL